MAERIRRVVAWVRWVLAGRPTARVAPRFHPPQGGTVKFPATGTPLPMTAFVVFARPTPAVGEVVEVRGVWEDISGWHTEPPGYEREIAGVFQTNNEPMASMPVLGAKLARGVRSLAEMRAM